MAGFFDQIEPLKQTALAELRAAARPRRFGTDQRRVDRAKRQIHAADENSACSRKRKSPPPAELTNARKVETRSLRSLPRRERIGNESRAAEGTDRFHAARPPPRARAIASAHASHRRYVARSANRFLPSPTAGDRGRISCFDALTRPRPPARADSLLLFYLN